MEETQALHEAIGTVERVEESNEGVPKQKVRRVYAEFPGPHTWDKDKIRFKSDTLQVGDSVRCVVLTIPKLTVVEVEAAPAVGEVIDEAIREAEVPIFAKDQA